MKTDIPLQKDILDELVWDPAVNASRIGVAVFRNGSTVTLRGSVHSWPQRKAAQGATWSAPGVTNVINERQVHP